MLYWIYDLPSVAMAALFCVGSVLFTCGGLLLLRPQVRRWLGPQPGSNEFVAAFLSAYGVFYGLMLGLIAVATYQNYSTVENSVQKEATAVGALYRDISMYPEPTRQRLQQHLRNYVRFIIDDAWPAQQLGQSHPGGTPLVTAIHEEMAAFDPANRREEMLHAEALREFNSFVEARFNRLEVAGTALSPVLWWVVGIGAALNFALLWMFSIDRLSVHLVLSGMLSMFVGLMLFFIAAMDHPFRGEESIQPEPYRLIRERLMGGAPVAAAVR